MEVRRQFAELDLLVKDYFKLWTDATRVADVDIDVNSPEELSPLLFQKNAVTTLIREIELLEQQSTVKLHQMRNSRNSLWIDEILKSRKN